MTDQEEVLMAIGTLEERLSKIEDKLEDLYALIEASLGELIELAVDAEDA